MKSILPPDIKPVSMKLGILEPLLDSTPPSAEPKPWAGNPNGNPGKPLERPAMKEAGKFANIGETPESSPRPESRDAVPLAE